MAGPWEKAKDLMSEIAGEAAEQVGAVPVPKSGERIRAEQRAEAKKTPEYQKLAGRAESLAGTEALLREAGHPEAAARKAAQREDVLDRLSVLLDSIMESLESGAKQDKKLGEQVARLDRRLSRLDHARA